MTSPRWRSRSRDMVPTREDRTPPAPYVWRGTPPAPGHDHAFDLWLAHRIRCDFGNALRLAARFGDRLAYAQSCGPRINWFLRNGDAWERAANRHLIADFARSTVAAMEHEIAALREAGLRHEARRLAYWHQRSSREPRRIVAMLEIARHLLPLPVGARGSASPWLG